MKTFIRAMAINLVFILLCGIIYPLGMMGFSQLFFPKQANGSIIEYKERPVGSELLGQSFTSQKFFRGRVQGPSNLAPSNPALVERVTSDMDVFLAAHPGVRREEIPTDLMTGSASGLDPHISKEAALVQVSAVAKATGISPVELELLIEKNTEGRTFGIFGAERVNVLKLNLDIAAKI